MTLFQSQKQPPGGITCLTIFGSKYYAAPSSQITCIFKSPELQNENFIPFKLKRPCGQYYQYIMQGKFIALFQEFLTPLQSTLAIIESMYKLALIDHFQTSFKTRTSNALISNQCIPKVFLKRYRSQVKTHEYFFHSASPISRLFTGHSWRKISGNKKPILCLQVDMQSSNKVANFAFAQYLYVFSHHVFILCRLSHTHACVSLGLFLSFETITIFTPQTDLLMSYNNHSAQITLHSVQLQCLQCIFLLHMNQARKSLQVS